MPFRRLLHRQQRTTTPRWLALAWWLVLGWWLAGAACASAAHAQPAVPAADSSVLVVFVREGCPHCADAKRFLEAASRDRPSLRIVYRQVDQDPLAAEQLAGIFRGANMWPPGVPTFVIGGRALVGFDTAETTGPSVLALIDEAVPPPADEVKTAVLGTVSASRLGLPLFTLALGLLDGFNPCAMWVLLFLLSLLVRLQNRARMALIAGTFVLVSGVIYYAFMAAWLNVFLAVGLTAALRWTLGGLALVIGAFNVKDFFAFGKGLSFSIPASAKPGLYARARAVLNADALPASLIAVAALAVVVNIVELLCTAGLPAIYTAVLTQQRLEPAAHYAYLGLYIVGYIFDDSLMVAAAVIALSSRKLTEGAGRWLKLLSGAAMIALGGLLLLRPEWLF
jgi:glutaredoxin